ncbi:MAG TPA: FMN-binding negative transcriptional regulator [Blastococcus sp.]|nr:FMN-binding negative transcriptional regulator [Blastococcus sp.]
MYVPGHFAMDDGAVQDLLLHHGAGELVTATERGLVSTLLPFVYAPAEGDHGSLLGHFARTNEHWRLTPVGEAMVILRGPDAYISPGWYASKAEHGRVVPTWNYSAVQFTGRIEVLDDPVWVRGAVERLTDLHEDPRRAAGYDAWAVTDAPENYVDKQLRAIVGLELTIEGVSAKAKLSQNRSEADADGVVAGLRREGGAREGDVANAMERLARPPG